MGEPVKVKRYKIVPKYEEYEEHSCGEFCEYDDIAPLLAELATRRERTRRRDAATEPPPEGVWVLGLDEGGYFTEVIRRPTDGKIVDANGDVCRCVTAWWPLPQTEE